MAYMSALSHGLSHHNQMSLGGGFHQGNHSYPAPRVPSLPDTGYPPHAYPATSEHAQTNYTATSGSGLKSASSLGQHYFVDSMMNPHPYSSIYPPFDINAVRRKNATRETTGPLKAWLSQHRKNPYPTKGEKVMLAIATRMTLTQVSTWFANARRRMKKDNFDEDEDESKDSDNDKLRERSGSLSSRVSQSSSEADISRDSNTSREIDVSDTDDTPTVERPHKKCVQRLFSPDLHVRPEFSFESSSSPESVTGAMSLPTQHVALTQQCLPPVTDMLSALHYKTKPVTIIQSDATANNVQPTHVFQKPKIWSISNIISPADDTNTGSNQAAHVDGVQPDQCMASTYSVYNNQGYPTNSAADYHSGPYMNMLFSNSFMQGSNFDGGNTSSHHVARAMTSHGQTSNPLQFL